MYILGTLKMFNAYHKQSNRKFNENQQMYINGTLKVHFKFMTQKESSLILFFPYFYHPVIDTQKP